MSLSGLDLNLLLVLHTVLRERNVARAAKRLNVTGLSHPVRQAKPG